MRLGVVAAVVLSAVAPASARAAAGDYCVGLPERGDCAAASTLTDALAQPGRARVFLGAGAYDVAAGVGDGGVPVQIAGLGATQTRVGAVDLTSSGSRISDVELDGALAVAGRAERVRATAGVTLLAGEAPTSTAQLAQAVVDGGVTATGPALLDDVDATPAAGDAAALTADCATVLARGVTLHDGAANAVATGCAGAATPAAVSVRSSVLGGADPVAAGSAVTTAYSAHAADADATATDRLEPGAPLVDAGDPAPLAEYEPFEDAAGDTRIADGDGDGVLRRDVGAYEAQPAAPAVPNGNVLANGGAEDGTGGWTGSFGVAGYGTPSMLTARQGAALGGGSAYFSAGPTPSADALQRIELTGSAAAIDAGDASARLSGLLGGYGDDPDAVTLTAAFRDPEGVTLGSLRLGPVTPDERARDSNLLPRSAQGAIPARTRAIDVTLHGERAAGAYTDAYADNLALALSVPGVPVRPPVQPGDPIVPNLRPFSGVAILTARPAFSKRWRAPLIVACPDATVGRCSAKLELVARLPGATTRTRIAHFLYPSLAPGQAKRVTVRLLLAARRALKHKHQIRARMLTTSRDTQGVQRTRTVALRLKLPASKAKR